MEKKHYYSYLEGEYMYIPPYLMESLGEGFIMTRGLNGAIWMYDATAWECFYEKLQELPVENKKCRMFVRNFLSTATSALIKDDNIVYIPEFLRWEFDIKGSAEIRRNRYLNPKIGFSLEEFPTDKRYGRMEKVIE